MAINRKLFKGVAGPAAVQPGVIIVTGRVAIGATGAVGAQTGEGFTVARSNTGLYTITITSTNGVPAILSAFVKIGNNSNTVQHFAYEKTLPTTGIITVVTVAADAPETAADPASGSFLQFVAFVQNVSVTG